MGQALRHRGPANRHARRTGLLTGLALPTGLLVSLAGAPAAQAEVLRHDLPWSDILAKSVSFEIMSSALETGLFLAFYGGSPASAGGIFLLNFGSATATYVAHEVAWDLLTPHTIDPADPALVTGKTAVYRVISTTRSFLIGSFVGGGHAATSLGFALSTALADSALYAATEFAFAHWRRPPRPAP